MNRTLVNTRKMMCIFNRWGRYLLIIFSLVFIGILPVFSQATNTNDVDICNGNNNRYVFNSSDRTGLWTVEQGSGTFSNPTSHDYCEINNIGYGINIFHFYDNTYPPGVPEHILTVNNTKVYAGRDTILCFPNTTFQLNASDPAVFPGSSGEWTRTAGSGIITNKDSYNTTVTGLAVGINRFQWFAKDLPNCGNSSDEITITVVNPPNAFAGNDQHICAGGTATLTANAGAGFTYLWSTGATTQTINVTPAASQNYQVTVTNPNKCSASDDIDVFVDELNFYNLTSDATSFCSGGTGVTLSLSGSEIGVNYQLKNGAANVGAAVAGTGGILTWSNITAGSYTIVATNPTTTCSETMNGSVVVTANPLPTAFNFTASSPTYCTHTSGVTLSLNNSENGANFQYQLYKNGSAVGIPPVAGTGGALTWNNITAGNYSVTTINTLTTCSSNMIGTPIISSITSPSMFNVAGSGSYCELSGGLPVTLDGSEVGINYQLLKDGFNSGAPSVGAGIGLSWGGNLAGTYTIRASNAGATCTRLMSNNAVLTEMTLPSVYNLTSSPSSYCSGGTGASISLSGSQLGVEYQLFKGGVASGSPVTGDGNPLTWPNNLVGAYTIEATNVALGCTQLMNGTINITENPLPVQFALPLNAPFCSNTTGATITLSSSENGSNFQYQLYKAGVADGASIPGTGASISWTGKTEGDYTVITTNTSTGCKSDMTGTSTVTMLPSPAAFNVSGTGAYCQGTSGLTVKLSGSENAVISYQLLKNGIIEEASKTGTLGELSWSDKLKGTYTVSATNTLNNCNTIMNGTAVVTEVALPTVYTLSGITTSYCAGTSGVTLNLNGSQLGIKYTLKKDGIAIGTVDGTGLSLSWPNSTAGVYTVDAQTTNPIACSVSMIGSVNVTTLALPVANAGIDQTVCLGQSAQLEATGGNTYSWSPVASLNNASIANPFATPSSTTIYTVTVTDNNGCSKNDDVQVTVRALPNAVASTPATICNGDNTILTATDNIIGNSETYLWSTGSTNDTIKVNPSTNTTYNVTITDAFGCKNSTFTSVTVNQKPGVNAGSDTKVCQGGSITLNGGGDANTWLWSTGATTLSTSVSPSSTTDYILKGTYTATGCFTSDTVKVTVNPLPVVSFILDGAINTQFCSNGALVVLAGTPAGGSFTSSSAGAVSGSNFNPATAGVGIHTITYNYTNPNSCTGTASINVNIVAPPVPTITGLALSYCNTSSPFTVTGNPLHNGLGVFGTWSFSGPAGAMNDPGDGTCTIDPTKITVEGVYTLTYSVGNSSLCNGTVSKTFDVKLGPSVNFVGLPASICKNSGPITLAGNQGAGGTFAGLGITDNGNGTASFDPVSLLPGNYNISFSYTHPVNLCAASTSKTVTVNQLPTVFSVTGGGSYCSGGAGVSVGLSGSTMGVNYELFHNGFSTGINEAGTGAAITFVNQTLAGAYTVKATNTTTLCMVDMDGNATINIDPLPLDAQIIVSISNSVCPGSTQNFTVPIIQNADQYVWQLPVNATLTSGVNTNSIDITFASDAVSGNLSVYGKNLCGNGGISVLPITVKALPAADGVITGDDKICQGEPNVVYNVTTITNATSYLWTVPSGATIESGQGTQTIVVKYSAGALSGNITVQGVNSCGNGVIKSFPVSVTATPQLSVNAPSGSINCSGNSVTVSATSSTPGVSYSWSAINGGHITSATNVSSATVNSTGSYIITVTEPLNSCATTNTVNVVSDMQAPQNVNITFDPTNEITCLVTETKLTATTTSVFPVGYQWTASSGGNITSAGNTAIETVNKGGVYEVKVTNLNTSCFTTKSITINEVKATPDIIVTNPEDEKLTCTKSSVKLTGSSITSGVSYSWSGPGIVSDGNTATPTVNSVGTYTLTVTAPNGCPASATVQVLSDNSVPTITVNTNPSILSCLKDTVILKGSSTTAGALLSWAGPGIVLGGNTQTPVVDQPGVYTLTVRHPITGCPSSAMVTVTENSTNPSVTFPILPSTITCAQTSVTISSSTSATNKTFQWSTINGTIVSGATNQNVVVSKAGTYTLVVTDTDNGCTGTASVNVNGNTTLPDATIAAPADVTCTVTAIDLIGSSVTTPINVQWTTTDGHFVSGANTLNPKVDKGGTYLMKVTNTTNQCYSEASVLVNELTSKPVISINNTPDEITCATPAVTLYGASVDADLFWTGPAGATISDATSPTTTVDKAGEYFLTATNIYGCFSTASVDVTENIAQPAGLSIEDPGALSCTITSLLLKGNSTTPSSTYKWTASNGGTILSADNDKNITIGTAGDYTMVVTHPTSFCPSSKTISVSQVTNPPAISFPLVPEAITCTNLTSDLAATVTPGSILLWTGPGSISDPTINNPEVSAAGIYTLKATNPVTGCSTTSALTVPEDKVHPLVTIANPNPVTCTIPSVLLDATTGISNFEAEWSTSNGTIIGATDQLDALAGKEGLYTLVVTNNDNGCETSTNVLVVDDNTPPHIMVDPNPAKITCSVSNVKLYGTSTTPGASLLWTGPGGTSTGITSPTSEQPEVSAIGTYTLTVTGTNGCQSTASVTVTENKTAPALPAILPYNKITCINNTVDLTVSPVPVNADILWTTSGAGHITNETTFKATVDAIGTYTVTYSDRTNGCTSQNSFIVTEDKTVSDATIVGSYEINCTDTELELEGTTVTGINPLWTASSGGHIVSGANTLKPRIDAAGSYTFTVTNPITGCPNSSSVVVGKSADLPGLTIDAFPDELTCTRLQVTLSGQPTEAGTTFTWSASPGHFLPGYETIPNPTVDEPGTYILTVIKTATGCKNVASINVIENVTPPQAVIAVPEKFTCAKTEVQIKASSTDPTVSVLWTTSGTGSIKLGDENIWNPTVLTPATYTLTVTNLSNQCSSTQNIVVTEDKNLPNINVDKTPLPLTCNRKQVILSGNSLTPDATYLWTTSGSGSISNPSSKTPAVDAVGTYTLKVTNPVNGCSITDVVTVTEDITSPQIWVNTTPSILNCIRDTVYLKGNSTTSNVTYAWSGPGIISNPAAKEPYVDSPGVYNLTVTSVSNGCTSSLPVTVIKNETEPAAPLLIGNAACFGTAATSLTAVGNNIQWYSNPALGSAYKVHSGNSYTPSSVTLPNDYSFYATQTDVVSQCQSSASQVTYTIRSLPVAPININKTICEGDLNTTLTASGNEIKWHDTPGGAVIATGTYTPAVTAPGTYTYYITQTDAYGCESPSKDISLTIQPKPLKPVVNQLSASICKGGINPGFTASGTNLKWYTSPSLPAPVETGGTFNPLETTSGTYSYYVTQTSSFGCVSPYETVTLNIRPLPQPFTVLGGGVYCENTAGLSVGLDGSELNTSYQLILNGTTVVTSLNGTGAALDFGLQKTVGNYTVKAIDTNTCESMMNGGVSISSNLLPGNALSITGQTSVCEGAANMVYSVPAISNADSYTWNVPAGAVVTSGLNTRSITIDFVPGSVTGQVSVYASNVCGSGAISPNLQVILNPLPVASGNVKYVAVNNLICLGDSGKIYEVDPIANATSYEWVLPAGATVYAGANSRQIRVKFATNAPTGNQIVKVRGVNSCGAGAYSTPYNIAVNPNPSVYAGIDQNLCSTQTALQGSVVPVGGNGSWNQVLGYSAIINNVLSNTQVNDVSQGLNIFTWKVTYNGCSSIDTVKIFNNKVDVDAGESLPICSQNVTLRGSIPPAGTSGVWTIASGSASIVAASQANTIVSNFGYGDNKLYWTVTKNGCESRDSIIITNYRPFTPDAGADQTICMSKTVLAAVIPVYGTGKWSVYSGQASFADITDPKTAVTLIGKGVNKLVWTVTNMICSLSDTIIITNNELTVNAGYDQIVCENRATLEGTAVPTGSTGQWSVLVGSASFLDNRSNNTKISGLVNGTNQLIWSITRGSCINTDTMSIVCNMPSSANAGPDVFLASGNTIMDGNLPVVGTGKWSIISGAATFANVNLYNTAVTGLNPGTNILRWTITYNNCNTFDEVSITNGTIEKVDAGQDQVICTNQTNLEAARPQYGFGIWTVQKGSANFDNNETYNTKVTNLAAGTNILRWSVVVSGIEFYDTVTIVNNQPTFAITGPRQILCIDSSALTGNLPVQGTGRWTLEGGAAVIQNINQSNSKVTQLGSGENIFRWTITKGTCVSSALLVITNDKPTPSNAGMDQTICDNKSTLIPNPAYIGTGEWSVVSGSGRFTNNEVTGLASGQNILRWTIRKNNCSSYDDMVVISHKPTAASAGINTVTCIDSLNLSANRPNSAIGEFGRWTIMNGSGQIKDSTLNTSLVRRLAQGVNVLRWTINNNGCISYSDVQINYAFESADAGLDIATCDNHIILSANNPTLGTGEWSIVGGSGSAVFTDAHSPNTEVKNLDQGNNILKWTISNFSCYSSSEVIISNNAPSVAFAGGDQSLCLNNTTLSARQPFIGKGSWSVLSGSGLFSDSSAYNSRVYNIGSGSNTYRWTVRNQNCSTRDEVVISNNKPIGTYAGLDQILCLDSANLTANHPIVGTGVWSITKGAGQIKDVYNAVSSIIKLAADTNIVRWTVSNKQCVEYQEIKLINNLPSIPLAGADRVLCSDQTSMDGNSPLHGQGEWFIISGSGTFTNKNIFNTEVKGLSLGKNIFRWKINKQGCILNDDVILTNDLPTKPNAGTDIAVCDNNSPLNANKPAVGTGYWSIVSGNGVFIDSTQYNTRIVGLGQGGNLLTWTTVHNRCALVDVVEVRNNMTNVFAGPDQIVFENSSMLVGNEPLRGVGTWSLNGGGGSINTPNNFESIVTGLEQGINTFLWSVNISGCISSDAVQITYYRIPTASFSINHLDGCPPLEVKFTKTTIENYPFKYYFGDKDSVSTEENPIFTYTNPGKYSAKMVVTGPDGKPVEMVKSITVHELPVANFELVPLKVYLPDGELRGFNYSDRANSYLWNFGDGGSSDELNPSYKYQDPGTYTVKLKVWSEFGCVDSLTIENGVEVIESSTIKFPSAITPNTSGGSGGSYNRNDYSNDVFYPILITGEILDYHLEIYNRWGVLLFESNDINIGWDGYYKEKLMMEDVYIYRVSGRLNNGKKINSAGDFMLMRKGF